MIEDYGGFNRISDGLSLVHQAWSEAEAKLTRADALAEAAEAARELLGLFNEAGTFIVEQGQKGAIASVYERLTNKLAVYREETDAN